MVHQWKITKNDGLNLIHKTIRESLIESNNTLDLNELVKRMNVKTQMNHIHHLKKYNKLSKYIKSEYGGIIKFIDTYSIYGISYQNNLPQIHLLNDADYTVIPSFKEDEWVIL